MAVALDADELSQYRWWVNSGQEAKKFQWASPDKAGTEPVIPLAVLAKKFQGFAGGVEKAKEVAKHLQRPLVYLLEDGSFEDENFKPLIMTDDIMNIAVVVRKPRGKEQL